MGTPDYMAPEQIEGQRGDQRTDIYALGIMLYEMLAGEVPFSGDTNLAVMAQHLNGTATRLDKVNPAIPVELAAITALCLARNPEERYADMPALMDALDHPESADLSILEKAAGKATGSESSFVQSQTLKAIGIAIVILLAIVALALALQSLR
jgi:serine/threonine-protein kinase